VTVERAVGRLVEIPTFVGVERSRHRFSSRRSRDEIAFRRGWEPTPAMAHDLAVRPEEREPSKVRRACQTVDLLRDLDGTRAHHRGQHLDGERRERAIRQPGLRSEVLGERFLDRVSRASRREPSSTTTRSPW
jgi:hypothetical protein